VSRCAWLAATLAAIVAVVVPDAAVARSAPRRTVLSNERTVTRWGSPAAIEAIRAAPSARSRAVGRLHWTTEDGYAEVYVVLERYVNATGTPWLKIRIPRRPNGAIGWVHAQALGRLTEVRDEIVIDRAAETLTLYRRGHRILRVPVGVGKPSTPTPPGHFWIREKIVALDHNPLYGPYALGTSDYSTLTDWPGGGVVGIHGTDEPWLVPGTPSHGCVRLRNGDITRLYKLVSVGTPVLIR
jgi:lipoprotein-anchoring transpeptidase ErfK/SrfK